MSGSANQLPIVIRLSGVTEAERAFTQLGNSGAASMAKIGSASDQASRQNIAAMDQMRGSLTGVTSAAQAAASSMGSFGAALTSPTAAIAALSAAASAGVVQVARIGDEYTNTMNKLRAATGSLGAASAVYGQLVAMSQQTGASSAALRGRQRSSIVRSASLCPKSLNTAPPSSVATRFKRRAVSPCVVSARQSSSTCPAGS